MVWYWLSVREKAIGSVDTDLAAFKRIEQPHAQGCLEQVRHARDKLVKCSLGGEKRKDVRIAVMLGRRGSGTTCFCSTFLLSAASC